MMEIRKRRCLFGEGIKSSFKAQQNSNDIIVKRLYRGVQEETVSKVPIEKKYDSEETGFCKAACQG